MIEKNHKMLSLAKKTLAGLLSVMLIISVFGIIKPSDLTVKAVDSFTVDYSSENKLIAENFDVLEGDINTAAHFTLNGDTAKLGITSEGGKYIVGRMSAKLPERSRVTEFSYKVKTAAEQPKRALELIYDFTSLTDFKSVGLSGNKTNSQKVYNRTAQTGEATGSVIGTHTTAAATQNYSATFTVNFKYTYDVLGKATATLTISNTNYTDELVINLGEVTNPCAILSGGTSGGANLSNTYGLYSDVVLKYDVIPDMSGFVSAFKAQYPIPDIDTITEANAESAMQTTQAVIDVRESLTDIDQYDALANYMVECKSVIARAKAVTSGAYIDDFSDESYTKSAFTDAEYLWPTVSSEEKASKSVEIKNGILKLTTSSTNGKIAPVYELSAGYIEGFSLATSKFFIESGYLTVSFNRQKAIHLRLGYGEKDAVTGKIPITSARLEIYYKNENKCYSTENIISSDAAWTTDKNDPSGWLRFVLSTNTSGYPTVRILNANGDAVISNTVSQSVVAIDSSAPLALSTAGGTTLFDELGVYYNLNSNVEYTKTKQKFLKDYSELLLVTKATASLYYKEIAEKALTTYNSWDDDSPLKYALSAEKAQITNILTYINNNCDDSYLQFVNSDDYSKVFTEDFESGLDKWLYTKGTKVIEDTDKSSNVIQIPTGAFLTPKSYVIPEKAKLTSYSFKMKVPGDVGTSNVRFAQIVYNYVDANNYELMRIYHSDPNSTYPSDTINIIFETFKDGEGTQHTFLRNKYQFNLSEWFNVSINYNDYKVSIELSDDKQETVYVTTSRKYINGVPALAGWRWSDGVRTTLFDDVKATFVKGDWDEDLEIDKIYAYYSGNTLVGAGDTVTVTGEKLYDTVYSIRILEIGNTGETNPGYILQNGHNYSAEKGNYFTEAEYAIPLDSPVWEESGMPTKILQATDRSIKFRIPETFNKGIYAVKFYGADKLSSEDDGIIYLNLPHIEGATGDEGEIATKGGNVQLIGQFLALDVPVDEEKDDYIETVTDKVKVMLMNDNTVYTTEKVTVLSPYSIKFDIPETFAEGTYEAVLYNGYGDKSCWSLPFKVKVGPNPRDSWPTEVFNIKDFGATGDREENATPYFVKALTVISENGGGVLYIPEGIYNLFHSVIIPENVLVRGDGTDKSIIFWSPDQWRFNELLPYQIGLTKNVAFENMSFYGTRMGSLFKFYGSLAENIYFNNIFVYTNPYAGTPTLSSGAVIEGQIWDKIRNELADYQAFIWCAENEWTTKVKNLQITNTENENTTEYTMRRGMDFRNCEHTKVKNNYFQIAWSLLWGKNTIWQNTTTDASTMAVLGENVYFANSTLKNRRDNNRELFVADWSATSFSGAVNAILTPVANSGGLKYTVNKAYSSGFLARGYQIYVVSGQGMGQTRTIVNNVGSVIELDTPFVIAPNSNSKVNIRVVRQNHYFVDNYYFNGLAGGYFGGYANVVYDRNRHERHAEMYFDARANDTNWYTSLVNETWSDPYVMHKYGSDNDYSDSNANSGSERSGINMAINFTTSGSTSSFNHTIRNNHYDNFYINFNCNVNNAISDVVIEKNYFENLQGSAIRTVSNDVLNGFLYSNNYLTNVGGYISIAVNSVTNPQGYAKQLMLDDDFVLLAKGDVNGDGEVDIKDCTLLKYYFAELTILSSTQLIRADFTEDDQVTLRDVSAIRRFIITGEDDFANNDTSPNDSSSNDSSSDDTSSDSSSSNSSSSNASSNTSSSTSSDSSSSAESSSKEFYPGVY